MIYFRKKTTSQLTAMRAGENTSPYIWVQTLAGGLHAQYEDRSTHLNAATFAEREGAGTSFYSTHSTSSNNRRAFHNFPISITTSSGTGFSVGDLGVNTGGTTVYSDNRVFLLAQVKSLQIFPPAYDISITALDILDTILQEKLTGSTGDARTTIQAQITSIASKTIELLRNTYIRDLVKDIVNSLDHERSHTIRPSTILSITNYCVDYYFAENMGVYSFQNSATRANVETKFATIIASISANQSGLANNITETTFISTYITGG